MQQQPSANMGGHAQPATPQPASATNYAIHVEPLPQEPYINNDVIREGRWETGLSACFSNCVPNCLMATFVPCVSLAQISSRIDVASYTNALLAFLLLWTLACVFCAMDFTYDSSLWNYLSGDYLDVHRTYGFYDLCSRFSTWMWLSVAFNALFVVGVWQLRYKVRQRFNIPGNTCADAFAAWCCSCCAIAQMATHVKSYRPGTCDFGPVDTLPAYQPTCY